MKTLRVAVSGCCGRMGSLIIEEALKNADHLKLVGMVEHGSHPEIGKPLSARPDLKVSADLKTALRGADLLIEFTTPEATLEHARIAAAAKVPMVIGTTGFTPIQLEELQTLSRRIPIFWSPNMSIGIVIVRRTIAAISQLLFKFGLSEKTSVRISEVHHSKKLDKPSGTAKALAQELFKVTGWLIRDEEIEAKREGDVIGIHAVTFRCPSELITLRHDATDRRVFAQGALLVARNFHLLWKKPGWYTMDHFVNTMEKTR